MPKLMRERRGLGRPRKEKPTLGEKPTHIEVFQYYYQLMENPELDYRSPNALRAALPDKLKRGIPTLAKWIDVFLWDDKCLEIDARVDTKVTSDIVRDTGLRLVDVRSRVNKLVSAGLKGFERQMENNNGVLPLRNVGELEKLVNMAIRLSQLNEDGSQKKGEGDSGSADPREAGITNNVLQILQLAVTENGGKPLPISDLLVTLNQPTQPEPTTIDIPS